MKKLIPIFVVGFFFSAHLALLAYLNSSMLSQFGNERLVSVVFTIGSALSLVLVFLAPKIVKSIGNIKLSGFAIILSALLLVAIGSTHNNLLVIPLFIVYFSINAIIIYSLDIYVEHYSRKNKIGNIRGLYLTIGNIGWLTMPVLAGFITTEYSISTVYLVAAFILLCALIVLVISQRNFKDNEYLPYSGGQLFVSLKYAPEIRRIITLNFLLQFFYALMVLYMPIYLRVILGFSFAQIGIIFTFMLLPFMLFEYPIGRLADKIKNGEKKFIISGLIVAGVSTILLMTIREKSVPLFAFLLFMTRVGASSIEVSCDSYFFKKITDEQTGLIGIYRNMMPLAYIIGPLSGALILGYVTNNVLFTLLGILLLCGAIYALRIPNANKEDTVLSL